MDKRTMRPNQATIAARNNREARKHLERQPDDAE